MFAFVHALIFSSVGAFAHPGGGVFLCEVVSGISVFGVVFSVRARSCAGLGFFSSPCLSLLYLNTTRLLPAFGALIAWNTMSNLFLSKPGAIY
jgi:hypothetical protein